MSGKLPSGLVEASTLVEDDLFVVQKDGESSVKKVKLNEMMSIYAHGSIVLGTPTVGIAAIGASPQKIVAFDAKIPATDGHGITTDPANGRITMGLAGSYMIAFTLAFEQDDQSDETYKLELYKNGVATIITSYLYTSSSNEHSARSYTIMLEIASGDYIEQYISCLTGTEDITVHNCQLMVNRAG